MKEDLIYLTTDPLGKEQLYYNIDTLKYSDSINDLITSREKDGLYFSTVLKFGYNYDDRTPYKNIKRVLPGERVILSKSKRSIYKEPGFEFDFNRKENKNIKDLLFEKIKEELTQIPKEEKEIGVLLSGGIDSSIVSAILLQLKEEGYISQDLRFFSINNSEDTEYIELFEKRFNIKSTRLNYDLSNLTDDEKKEVLKINETPVDLGSLFPTYVMFKELQKQNIRYIFTGDGPDELFGGYKRIDEYDSQLSDIFYELSFYHFPRLNKLARYFGLILKTPWCDEEMVRLAVNLPLKDRTHKKIMKDNFKDLIPEEIINREKRPLKNDLIKEDKRSYRNELVELFYEIMNESDDKILSEIYNECSKCSNQYSCPEEECALYRIEQIVLEEGEK